MCLAALEASGTVWTASAPIQLAKSETVGCLPSEPLDTLIGGLLANQHSVWKGRNSAFATELYGVRFGFLCNPFHHFLFSCFGLLAQD